MKIGYPCINLSVQCSSNRTFRLRSYSEQRLRYAIENNLICLGRMLEFNRDRGLLFFRISSGLVPFASHPVCGLDWRAEFKGFFASAGMFIKESGIRISMHPDQFVVINALDGDIVKRSVAELEYHADVLDLLGLDETAKMQIHVGGVYGEKNKSVARFIENYGRLPEKVIRRLVIENDERNYSLKDCLAINEKTGVPVLFDWFHHRLNGGNMKAGPAMKLVSGTWKKKDGLPMSDYSSQQPGARAGAHAYTIDTADFKSFLSMTKGLDFDIMLEIKDKEKSAIKAVDIARADKRFSAGRNS